MNQILLEKKVSSLLKQSSVYDNKIHPHRKKYIEEATNRFANILRSLRLSELDFKSPTLDVGSGLGLFYPCLKKFFPKMLPCTLLEHYHEGVVTIDGEQVNSIKADIEREKFPISDKSFKTVLFLDVVEHLLYDPIFSFLEFNRILGDGGHLVINTPNAASLLRVGAILSGENPASENRYKDHLSNRHNREWTIKDFRELSKIAGFEIAYSNTGYLVEENLYKVLRSIFSWVKSAPREDLGPEIFIVMKKKKDIRPEKLSKNQRYLPRIYDV